jgi:hypothetical protein
MSLQISSYFVSDNLLEKALSKDNFVTEWQDLTIYVGL